jgi:uncharacterized protein YukE
MEVDTPAVRQQGTTVCDLAEHLREIRDRWDRQTNSPEDALGYREVTGDYQEADSDWYAELTVYIDVLDELCSAIRGAADNYQGTDHHNSQQYLT